MRQKYFARVIFIVTTAFISLWTNRARAAGDIEVVVLVNPTVKNWIPIFEAPAAKFPIHIIHTENSQQQVVPAKYRFEEGKAVEKLKDWHYAIVVDAPVKGGRGFLIPYTLYYHQDGKPKPIVLVRGGTSCMPAVAETLPKTIFHNGLSGDVAAALGAMVSDMGKGVPTDAGGDRPVMAYAVKVVKRAKGDVVEIPLHNTLPVIALVDLELGHLYKDPAGKVLLGSPSARLPTELGAIKLTPGEKRTIIVEMKDLPGWTPECVTVRATIDDPDLAEFQTKK